MRNIPPLLVVFQVGTTTLEISLVIPQKIGHIITYTTPGHIPKRCSNTEQEYILHYVYSNLIYNSQKLEKTQMSFSRGMNTENVVFITPWSTTQLLKIFMKF